MFYNDLCEIYKFQLFHNPTTTFFFGSLILFWYGVSSLTLDSYAEILAKRFCGRMLFLWPTISIYSGLSPALSWAGMLPQWLGYGTNYDEQYQINHLT